MNFFNRQKLIPNWNQDSFNKSILILGVGGIGCHQAVSCCRLGIRDILLVDMDTIEDHNLNRQILYNKAEIGNKKVLVAQKHLNFLHSLETNVEVIDLHIFKNWQDFVPLVKKSDFVLNGLDCPEVKRVAVAALCLKYKKPMIYAGTDIITGNAGMVLFQDKNGQPCYECLQACLSTVKPEYYDYFILENIEKHKEIPIEKISTEKEHPIAASTNYTASIISNIAISLMVHYLQSWSELPNRVIIDLYNLEIESWKVEISEGCPICKE